MTASSLGSRQSPPERLTFKTLMGKHLLTWSLLLLPSRYGDDLLYENSDSYIAEVLELIGKQNVRQCLETQGILLDELEFKHMFDCCLYFISPHQLKPVDLKFMAAISAGGLCPRLEAIRQG